MRDTIVVFMGMGVLLIIPILLFAGKCIIRSKKEKNFKYLYYRLIAAGIVCIAVILLIFNIYRFTIRYQAPLVAEQFLEVFIRRNGEKMGDEEYLKELVKAGLTAPDYRVEDYSYMEEIGIIPHESLLYLGENIYDNEDGTWTQYSQFEYIGESVFTAMDMKRYGDRWRIEGHRIISGDLDDYPEIKKRFYPIKEKP